MSSYKLLVDSSVWIEFLDNQTGAINSLLPNPSLCSHPFIVGELVVGNLGSRSKLISALQTVNKLSTIEDDAVVRFVRKYKLGGRRIGYIDCHLLASVFIDGNTFLWTSDKRLRSAAVELGVAFPSSIE